jgi:hypothetical protein
MQLGWRWRSVGSGHGLWHTAVHGGVEVGGGGGRAHVQLNCPGEGVRQVMALQRRADPRANAVSAAAAVSGDGGRGWLRFDRQFLVRMQLGWRWRSVGSGHGLWHTDLQHGQVSQGTATDPWERSSRVGLYVPGGVARAANSTGCHCQLCSVARAMYRIVHRTAGV